jgi:hypothetical protein
MSVFTPPPPPESPEANVPAPLPPRRGGSVPNALAFMLSAVLSPYLVILFGTAGIVYARSEPENFWTYLTISIFFSTILPALYVVYGIKKGFISDVHVMEREQRGGPFAVAIAGGFLSALILFLIGSPASVWTLSLIMSVNGIVIWLITFKTKISVHVSVLAATVLGASILHPNVKPLYIVWLVPALMWARWYRRRHTIWQGLGGAITASVITSLIIMCVPQLGGERLTFFFKRFFTP